MRFCIMNRFYKHGLLFCFCLMFMICCGVNLLSVGEIYAQPKYIDIGDNLEMREYSMSNTNGVSKPLSVYQREKGLLIIFSSNTCPIVEKYEKRYKEVISIAEKLGIGVILVNSNEAYRKNRGESIADMKVHAKEHNYTVPYLLDKNHQLADKLNARKTPHVFLFDNNFKLVYKGAIDDNMRESEVKTRYLAEALLSLSKGKNIVMSQTRSVGCTIKRM